MVTVSPGRIQYGPQIRASSPLWISVSQVCDGSGPPPVPNYKDHYHHNEGNDDDNRESRTSDSSYPFGGERSRWTVIN